MKKEQKRLLTISVLFFCFSLIGVTIFIISVNDNNNSKTTYNDLIYKELTVEGIREIKDPEGDNMYYIDVIEEEKNIKVNNLLTNKKVRNEILSLKKGDKIYCYLKNGSSYYEVVEIKTGNSTIISFDDYNEIYNRQSIIGFIVSPVLFAIMLGIAIKAFVVYTKMKKSPVD